MTKENSQNISALRRKTVFRTYADGLEAAVARMRESTDAPFARRILFVPDKYTLYAERLLYAGGGSFGAEVLTLNRLCYRLAEFEGMEQGRPLSRLEAVLTVRRILSQEGESLHCYGKSASYPGFGETVYDNLCQFAASGVRAADLTTATPAQKNTVLDYKLADLARIYEAYEQATAGKYVDAAGRLLFTERLLEHSKFFDDADVYFCCYDDFTPLQNRIVRRIVERVTAAGHTATIAETDASPHIADLTVYTSPSPADEIKCVAAQLLTAHRRGIRYDRMGVVLHGGIDERLRRIFAEYGIPYYADCKYALAAHPLARYVSDLFAAVSTRSTEAYVRLAANPYSGIVRKDADVFENYVYFCALGDGYMDRPFVIEPSTPEMAGTREIAEAVRMALHAQVARIDRRATMSGAAFRDAVSTVLSHAECTVSEAEMQSPISDARDRIVAVTESIAEIFSGTHSFADLMTALGESFRMTTVSTIPNRSDTVVVGEASAFRAGKYELLCVLGMREGEIPSVLRDDGILSDGELTELCRRGVRIEPKVADKNALAEKELDSVFACASRLYVTTCAESPSPYLRRAVLVAEQYRDESYRERLADVAEAGECLRAGKEYIDDERKMRVSEILAAAYPCESAIRDRIAAAESDPCADGGELAALRALVELPRLPADAPYAKGAKDVYAKRGISVSRVQEYFSCPMRCLLRHGLHLSPRPDGAVTVADVGTFLHKVIEDFLRDRKRRGVYAPDPDWVRRHIQTLVRDDPQALKGMGQDALARLTEEAVTVTSVAVEQIEKGEFRPEFFEKAFGFPDDQDADGKSLAGIRVPIGDRVWTLNGFIDRIDLCGNLARVIDYKTGDAHFSLADLYYGRKVQLPVYLAVAKQAGYTAAGMFYFPFTRKFTSDDRVNALQGLFDQAYAYETDRDLATPKHRSTVVKATSVKDSKPGDVRLHRSWSTGAADTETLAAVCDYALAVFAQGAREMSDGYCERSPVVYDNKEACTYCEVRPVCTACGGVRKRRKTKGVDKEFFSQWRNGVRAAEDGAASEKFAEGKESAT